MLAFTTGTTCHLYRQGQQRDQAKCHNQRNSSSTMTQSAKAQVSLPLIRIITEDSGFHLPATQRTTDKLSNNNAVPLIKYYPDSPNYSNVQSQIDDETSSHTPTAGQQKDTQALPSLATTPDVLQECNLSPNDLTKLKVIAAKLNLQTRRASYVTWRNKLTAVACIEDDSHIRLSTSNIDHSTSSEFGISPGDSCQTTADRRSDDQECCGTATKRGNISESLSFIRSELVR